MRFMLGFIAALFLSGAALAGEVEIKTLAEGEASPPATIDQLSWLVGYWKGDGYGGKAEEAIAPPAGGQMMGMFRQLKEDGSLNFYEFYTFSEENGSLTLKIKHFDPALMGWEAKDEYMEFPLAAIEENAVYFDGLTFALSGDTLRAAVMVEDMGVLHFTYQRAALD